MTGTIRKHGGEWVGGYEVYTKTTHSVLNLLMAVCSCPETFGEFNSVITLPHPSLHSFCARVGVVREEHVQHYDCIIIIFEVVNLSLIHI